MTVSHMCLLNEKYYARAPNEKQQAVFCRRHTYKQDRREFAIVNVFEIRSRAAGCWSIALGITEWKWRRWVSELCR
jgi:hypothetical protein